MAEEIDISQYLTPNDETPNSNKEAVYVIPKRDMDALLENKEQQLKEYRDKIVAQTNIIKTLNDQTSSTDNAARFTGPDIIQSEVNELLRQVDDAELEQIDETQFLSSRNRN